jgi:thymidylate synthase ThyX
MIEAKILADSKSIRGERLTTFLLTFPRIILAEFNTHRMFSRNSASSRAIPFVKMVESVETNPFIPIAWMKDHKGMQGTEYITNPEYLKIIISEWLRARDKAIFAAENLNKGLASAKWDGSSHELIEGTSVTKQLCNRLLEPFMWHTVICTATDYENFFKLRCPEYVVNWYSSDRPEALEPTQGSFKSRKDAIARTEGECNDLTEEDWRECNISQAEIHIQALAEAMWDAMNESTPKVLKIGEWHIPFADQIDINNLHDYGIVELDNNYDINELKIAIATAKCARVSYTTVGSTSNSSHTTDIELHNRLIESGHYSPLEHCAQVMEDTRHCWKPYSRNFKGFLQYREIVES